jgi:hypothetical protein
MHYKNYLLLALVPPLFFTAGKAIIILNFVDPSPLETPNITMLVDKFASQMIFAQRLNTVGFNS